MKQLVLLFCLMFGISVNALAQYSITVKDNLSVMVKNSESEISYNYPYSNLKRRYSGNYDTEEEEYRYMIRKLIEETLSIALRHEDLTLIFQAANNATLNVLITYEPRRDLHRDAAGNYFTSHYYNIYINREKELGGMEALNTVQAVSRLILDKIIKE